MFRGEPLFAPIILGDLIGCGQKSLEKRCLAIFVQVSFRIADRLGKKPAKGRKVCFKSAFRRGNDDASGRRKFIEKRAARGGGIDDGHRTAKWLEPGGQLLRREVWPRQ